MKMEKRYTKLLRSLNENFVAFDYDHEVLTHFQTKADGMKWKNHKNAPDSYYLVKTKHRLLKGDMASDGSDSLSKHLDSQPFPKKDGANFSVHKESVDFDEKGPKVDMKKYAAHMDRNKKKKTEVFDEIITKFKEYENLPDEDEQISKRVKLLIKNMFANKDSKWEKTK